MLLTRGERRARLGDARLLLIFTPDLAAADPLAALEGVLAEVDVVQVRPKPLGGRRAVTGARESYDWTRRVVDLCRALNDDDVPLVFVNDRIDVALALAEEGVDGVHVGADDTPVDVARAELGEDLLLGLSTHSAVDVALSFDQPLDLLGFGPVFATATKGYGIGDAELDAPKVVGPEAAWVAAESSPVPVFPIGGVDLSNADQLDRVGRAAVGSAILGASDPAAAARALRELLSAGQ